MELYYLLMLTLMTTTGRARLAEEPVQVPVVAAPPVEEDPCSNLRCYHKPPEACPPPAESCRCKVDTCRKAVICCNVDAYRLSEGLGCANVNLNRENISAIHIQNATISTLNLTELMTWRRLTSMSITDGRIGAVTGEFGKIAAISCLNLSSNGIGRFEDRSLVRLYNLSVLDLSHNNLSDVPRFKKGHITLDVSGNKLMQCKSLIKAIERPDLHFKNSDDTWCQRETYFQWFNSTDLVPLKHVEHLRKLDTLCPNNCTCEVDRYTVSIGKAPVFYVKVNCKSKRLTELPKQLPPNTIALDVSDNNITSLDPIADEPSYQSLQQLMADDNQITSINPLEGSQFIENFLILTLKNNMLKSVPTYFLSNILDRNDADRVLLLSGNKLTCDCNTAKVLRVWLMDKKKYIPDHREVECDCMNARVVELDPLKLCQRQQHDWTDYIYYVITAEVVLLVGLVAKVSYDYWVFKTAGYLPWPASKMPRLPCDWLCE